MVKIIEMRLDKTSMRSLHKEMRRLGRIPQKITSQAMQRWGGMLVNDMVRSAVLNGITEWRGNLFNGGIRWDQRPTGKVGKLLMPHYGVKLDSLPTRRVKVNRSTLLDKWVRDPRKIGRPMRTITVHRHKFIEQGYRMARPKLNMLIKDVVKKK